MSDLCEPRRSAHPKDKGKKCAKDPSWWSKISRTSALMDNSTTCKSRDFSSSNGTTTKSEQRDIRLYLSDDLRLNPENVDSLLGYQSMESISDIKQIYGLLDALQIEGHSTYRIRVR
jgi:hypothetical protein